MALPINVNVADQAFPPPPPDVQDLPNPFDVEVINDQFIAPPAASAPFAPLAIEASVASQPFIQPPFGLGTALPPLPNFDVSQEISVVSPAQEVIVTESGSFATNNTAVDVTTFTVVSVVTQGTAPTQVFQISLSLNGNPVTLSSYGVDFTQLFASFPAAAAASSPENIPSRPISAFNDPNTIVVPAVDSFGNTLTTPAPGNPVAIGIVRQGASNTVSTSSTINVSILPPPPVAVTTPAAGNPSLGNIFPPLPGTPFIGSGVAAPPFQGTFEVESQTPVGKGLPANVFV